MLVTDNYNTVFEVQTKTTTIAICKPARDVLEKTREVAKAIFMEAFTTTYTQYHRNSGSIEPIETWLGLVDIKFHDWLNSTFDEEYQEALVGTKEFVYLCGADRSLIGWFSHSPVSKTGEVYLSQGSIEAASRNQKIAQTSFAEAINKNFFAKLFPGAKEIKVIAREVNAAADHLYTAVGFTKDNKIDPSIYGKQYNNRYVGYRMTLTGGN